MIATGTIFGFGLALLYGVGAGRMPEFIEMMQVGLEDGTTWGRTCLI